MKILLLSDLHYGVRKDNQNFYKYQKNFFHNVVFNYIEKNGVDHVIMLGDLVDNRTSIHFETLVHMKNDFLNPLHDLMGDKVISIVGNHDLLYRNSMKINAVSEFVDFGTVVNSPVQVSLDGKDILFIPWICKDNREECEFIIHESQAEYCFGHFELKGFKDNNGRLSTYGDESTFLRSFKSVYSGHYHERSRQGNITYLGSAFEFIWSDYESFRGFSVVDTDDGRVQFFRNPYHIFSTIDYSTGCQFDSEIAKKVGDTYVRIFRKSDGGSDVEFNDYIKRIQDVGVIDLQIVQKCDKQIMELEDTPIVADNLKDTMLNYIDNQQYSNSDLIKDRFIKLYGRAERGS